VHVTVRAEPWEGKRSVLGRAFDILECFDADEPEQTISALSARTGLPPATVHRMLASLIEWGAVERASRGRYRLGRRLWWLGRTVPSTHTLKTIARPYLVDLHDVTGCISALCSPDGDRVAVVDVIAGRAALRQVPVPATLPLLSSAPGMVILAHSPPEDVRAIASDAGLQRRLADVRRAGFAVRRTPGPGSATWVAAPIFGENGATIRSALCLAAPGEEMKTGAASRVVSAAATAISRSLARTR
jgi:DNA-binding IclR family transcriptional regulator